MDFQLTSEQQRLQNKCRELAADFATRSAAHDRDASHPVENYDRLRKEGFLALTLGKEWGGLGASFLDHTIASSRESSANLNFGGGPRRASPVCLLRAF